MDPTFTVRRALERDGREHWAEVSIRFLPSSTGGCGLGETSNAQRYVNNVLFPLRNDLSSLLWYAVTDALKEGIWRIRAGGLVRSGGFRANVVRLEVSDGIAPDDAERLLREAGRQAAEDYFAAIDDGRVTLTQADVDREFAYLPETGFDDEFIARRPCFLEYISESRPAFLSGMFLFQDHQIEKARAERTLTASGTFSLGLAIQGYKLGCRPEADAIVEYAYKSLTLAHDIQEKPARSEGAYDLGKRYLALSYLHWLRTGERHEEFVALSTRYFLAYYQRARLFGRSCAEGMTPACLYLGADSILRMLAKRLARRQRTPTRPNGLFGAALRIIDAPDVRERDREVARLKKRLPAQFFNWFHRGHYDDPAYLLHALYPRPEGPPGRLIERIWDHLPDLVRDPYASFGWRVAKGPGAAGPRPDRAGTSGK